MKFHVETKGHHDFINITSQVKESVEKSKIKDGIAIVFVASSTAALTTMEFEKGIIQDLTEIFEKLAPEKAGYKHHKKWGDHNGAAHIKSALMGTNVSIPIEKGDLKLGTWQQIVLIDFDEHPRVRKLIVKVVETKT